MMTVNEVSKLTGVSVRTLQYYDNIGLLTASKHTESGYRLYDESALERLQQILLYRELEFPLKDIQAILSSPDFEKSRALEQQIELLEMKQAHIQNLIIFARGLKLVGGKYMDFSAFDTKKMDAYTRQAKASWGATDAYKEFEQKNGNRSLNEIKSLGNQLMVIVGEFGTLQTRNVSDPAVVAQVQKLQSFITEHYYTCTDPILANLGEMYGAGGDFTTNINAVGGEGAAEYACEAIRAYCANR